MCFLLTYTNFSVEIDCQILIFNISTLDNASKQDITFFHNPKYIESLKNTKAGACILKQEDKSRLKASSNLT